jgi:hypothetical protein
MCGRRSARVPQGGEPARVCAEGRARRQSDGRHSRFPPIKRRRRPPLRGDAPGRSMTMLMWIAAAPRSRGAAGAVRGSSAFAARRNPRSAFARLLTHFSTLRISCQAGAEHFQQCSEFLPAPQSRPSSARREGIARCARQKGRRYRVQLEDLENSATARHNGFCRDFGKGPRPRVRRAGTALAARRCA